MGLNGLEPSTSRLSGVRSNHLSYKPTALSSDGVPEKLWLFGAKEEQGSVRSFSPTAETKLSVLCSDVVEMRRVELLTPCLQGRCSPN